jgi:hypothetical protein
MKRYFLTIEGNPRVPAPRFAPAGLPVAQVVEERPKMIAQRHGSVHRFLQSYHPHELGRQVIRRETR